MIHLWDTCDTCHGKGYTKGKEAPAMCTPNITWGPRNEFGEHWAKAGTCLSRSSYHVYLKQGKGPRRKVYVRRGTCLGWYGPDFSACRYPRRQRGGRVVALCQLGFTCDRHDRFFACEYHT